MTLVYRLESAADKHNNLVNNGAYRSHFFIADLAQGHTKDDASSHPGPQEDQHLRETLLSLGYKEMYDGWGMEFVMPDLVFCFPLLESLYNWFSNIGNLNCEQKELIQIGVYEVAQEHYIEGKSQSLANSNHMFLHKIITL